MKLLDRDKILFKPLSERTNKVRIDVEHVDPSHHVGAKWSPSEHAIIAETVALITRARSNQKPVMLAFGAHTIKNGLGSVLIALMEEGWLTHLATNGAGIIHDWEFAFQGESSEDVRGGIERGEFGNWQETGFFLNLALNVGAYEGKGYGASIGHFIQADGLDVPSGQELLDEIGQFADPDPARAAAAADLLSVMRDAGLTQGRMHVPHPWKRYSVQAAAVRLGIPLTGHPMIGQDIIYNHPMNHCAAIGRAAERDFLQFAESVSRIDGGVYMSIGSAVMSPMVFEKSMSMAQNLALQDGRSIKDHFILVGDLAESSWDWSSGEPPEESPDYYLRYNKSFSRMGGTMRYLQADNRDILLELVQRL